MASNTQGPNVLRLGGREVPLEVRRNQRARRISLRVDGTNGHLRLTLPGRMGLNDGLSFAKAKADWILGQLDKLPKQVPFEAGAVVPVLGEEHVIRPQPRARRGVWREDGIICVSGKAEHMARRVTDFLKAEARREITSRARDKAAMLDHKVACITLRDTTSRWGSCGEDGSLSFSWRLILAPEEVLDYVVAHEVAHLKELNHGKRFWALTAKLTDEVAGPRRWLRRHGDTLLRYG